MRAMSAMRAMAGASLVVALLGLVGLARANTLLPGDPVPSFSVETLSGGEFCIVEGPQESPTVVYAFNTADGFSYAMFEDASVKRFLDTGPAGARYLFTCSDCVTNNEAKFVAKFMSDAIEGGLARGEGSRDAWRDRIHFASRALASDGVLAGVLKGEDNLMLPREDCYWKTELTPISVSVSRLELHREHAQRQVHLAGWRVLRLHLARGRTLWLPSTPSQRHRSRR